ncbi:penicillin-binding transpeptidase domain-containing protein [Wenjunlia tyrosinilytica]|uniref:Protein kinase domain-containing protein n=1 Tax=Wenjunlia tyrosinilytica TaxID=1544741 RepID=A0A918DV88_9ACTN|nr:penicillin-binding transpeptidase domain-containing protein [Wenjunlia tyrosinilytica]GGO84800.1 hypothetical protein GCM10012280_17110 [Wenjunlia tyrosinilytica]
MEELGADDPGEVGGYRVRGRLGMGGMGAVYLAYTRGGQAVALKVIRREFAQDLEFRRRFTREAEAARRVQGPYTAAVVDSNTEGPQPWLASAYVPGPSLSAAVRRHGPLPLPTVFQLTAGVAEALQSIHRVGVVHRDLKPSNVLLASDGPRVIDFGIARAADATALTGSDARLGTPAYMAPEQISGGDVGPALDVFALGLLTYFAATAGHPFGEGSGHALLYRIVAEQPDLSACPAELRDLVTACLAKQPHERPTPSEVIDLCAERAGEGVLERVSHGWLPPAVAGQVPRREPTPHPSPVPADVPPVAPAVLPPVAPLVVAPPPSAAPPPSPAQAADPPTRPPLSPAPVPTPSPERSGRRSPARIAGALLAALVVIGGATFAVVQLTGDGKGEGSGGNPAAGGKPLGDIVVAGKPVTGSRRLDDKGTTVPYQRTYTAGELYSSVTGFRSRAYGSSQLEAMFQSVLDGTDGRLSKSSGPGNVVTTIDPSVQKAAFEALGDKKGAAVAIDPSNGAILGLVSTPSYDPSVFSGNSTSDKASWTKLNGDATGPLRNRALRETYPPGATFQLVAAAAALESGLYRSVDDRTDSPDPYVLPRTSTQVTSGDTSGACANASLRTALVLSCSNVFAKAAATLGEDKVRATAEKFGFNTEKPKVPVAAAQSVFPEGMRSAEVALSGLGQFEVRATPLQMAMVSSALANGGKLFSPHMVARLTDSRGRTLRTYGGSKPSQVVSANTASELRKAMVDVVMDGTGGGVRLHDTLVGGKPGITQTSEGGRQARYTWFTSYAQRGTNGKEVAVAVVVEDPSPTSAADGGLAARITKRTISAAFD